MIIDDKYSIECKDGSNHNLIEAYFTEAKNGKESRLSTRVLGHYSDTYSALRAYVKRELENCEYVQDVVSHVDSVFIKIEKAIKGNK